MQIQPHLQFEPSDATLQIFELETVMMFRRQCELWAGSASAAKDAGATARSAIAALLDDAP